MFLFISGLITFVILLAPALYFFVEKKYKKMTLILLINIVLTSGLIIASQVL
jgi:hypothetical protein